MKEGRKTIRLDQYQMVKDVAECLRVAKATVRQRIHDRELRAIAPGIAPKIALGIWHACPAVGGRPAAR